MLHTRNPLAHRLVAAWPRLRLDRPIFVVGVPRSGTSIFVRNFARHHDLAHWSEAPTMWDARYRARDTDHRWTEEQATESVIRRIENNFAYYTKWKDKSRFVNKHPRNSLRIPFLMAGWPDAHIICVQRDPHAVVWSLVCRTRKEQWRSKYPLGQFVRPPGWREIDAIPDIVERFARAVAATHETLRDDLDRCVPECQRHIVRYEDLAADCRATLARVWKSCGLSLDEETLSEVPDQLTNMNIKWRRDMNPADIATMTPIVEPMLSDLGYTENASIMRASA